MAQAAVKKSGRLTNAEFVEQDQAFNEVCTRFNIAPTRRQASKWRNRKGLAYQRAKGTAR